MTDCAVSDRDSLKSTKVTTTRLNAQSRREKKEFFGALLFRESFWSFFLLSRFAMFERWNERNFSLLLPSLPWSSYVVAFFGLCRRIFFFIPVDLFDVAAFNGLVDSVLPLRMAGIRRIATRRWRWRQKARNAKSVFLWSPSGEIDFFSSFEGATVRTTRLWDTAPNAATWPRATPDSRPTLKSPGTSIIIAIWPIKSRESDKCGSKFGFRRWRPPSKRIRTLSRCMKRPRPLNKKNKNDLKINNLNANFKNVYFWHLSQWIIYHICQSLLAEHPILMFERSTSFRTRFVRFQRDFLAVRTHEIVHRTILEIVIREPLSGKRPHDGPWIGRTCVTIMDDHVFEGDGPQKPR